MTIPNLSHIPSRAARHAQHRAGHCAGVFVINEFDFICVPGAPSRRGAGWSRRRGIIIVKHDGAERTRPSGRKLDEALHPLLVPRIKPLARSLAVSFFCFFFFFFPLASPLTARHVPFPPSGGLGGDRAETENLLDLSFSIMNSDRKASFQVDLSEVLSFLPSFSHVQPSHCHSRSHSTAVSFTRVHVREGCALFSRP